MDIEPQNELLIKKLEKILDTLIKFLLLHIRKRFREDDERYQDIDLENNDINQIINLVIENLLGDESQESNLQINEAAKDCINALDEKVKNDKLETIIISNKEALHSLYKAKL